MLFVLGIILMALGLDFILVFMIESIPLVLTGAFMFMLGCGLSYISIKRLEQT